MSGRFVEPHTGDIPVIRAVLSARLLRESGGVQLSPQCAPFRNVAVWSCARRQRYSFSNFEPPPRVCFQCSTSDQTMSSSAPVVLCTPGNTGEIAIKFKQRFQAEYLRNNKTSGAKNMRCFPVRSTDNVLCLSVIYFLQPPPSSFLFLPASTARQPITC